MLQTKVNNTTSIKRRTAAAQVPACSAYAAAWGEPQQACARRLDGGFARETGNAAAVAGVRDAAAASLAGMEGALAAVLGAQQARAAELGAALEAHARQKVVDLDAMRVLSWPM